MADLGHHTMCHEVTPSALADKRFPGRASLKTAVRHVSQAQTKMQQIAVQYHTAPYE